MFDCVVEPLGTKTKVTAEVVAQVAVVGTNQRFGYKRVRLTHVAGICAMSK